MDRPYRAQSTDTSLFARVALALVTTLVFLLLLELGARGFEALSPPDPADLERWRPKRTPLPAPEPGALRVFLYGGSTIAGAPQKELGLAAQLEFWLHRLAPERPLQLVNFGVNGRSSAFVLSELERTLPAAPDLAIVLTVHNELIGWEPDSEWEQLRERLGDWIEQTALVRSFRRAGDAWKKRVRREPLRRPEWVQPDSREEGKLREHVAAYRENTAEIVRRTREAGVPLVLATGPANLADWPPAYRFTHDLEFGHRVEALRERVEEGALDEAEALLSALRTGYPDDAVLTFLAGRIAMARGEPERASALFDAARDADPVPWRALGVFNDHLRDLARRESVALADLDLAFRRAAEDGLVGFEWIADNCHPTPLGSALAARELILAMAREGLFDFDPAALPALPDQWRQFREVALGEDPDLWLEYLLRNAIYTMKGPFYDFATSRMYLLQAQALAPGDWRVPANLGTLAVLEGRKEEGRRWLERAAELRGEPLSFHDRGPTPYLREAEAILAGELEAFVPEDPGPAVVAAGGG